MPKHKIKGQLRWAFRPVHKLDKVAWAKWKIEAREIPALIRSMEPQYEEILPYEHSPQSNLIVAVVLDAIDQAKRGGEHGDSEIHWLFDEILPEPMTFGWYLTLLGIDAFEIRKKLLESWDQITFYDIKIADIARRDKIR